MRLQSLLFLATVIISIGICTSATEGERNCTDLQTKAAEKQDFDTSETVLSRKKRYVAFPEGSSFSVWFFLTDSAYLNLHTLVSIINYEILWSFLQIAYCMTIGMIGTPQFSYLSWSINFGVAYDLPNQTWVLNNSNRKPIMPKPVVLRRHRRDLYSRLETVINKLVILSLEILLKTRDSHCG